MLRLRITWAVLCRVPHAAMRAFWSAVYLSILSVILVVIILQVLSFAIPADLVDALSMGYIHVGLPCLCASLVIAYLLDDDLLMENIKRFKQDHGGAPKDNVDNLKNSFKEARAGRSSDSGQQEN